MELEAVAVMSKLRVLSGREVLKILGEFGFQDFAQRGSHIKLRRILSGGRTQTLTYPTTTRLTRHAPRHLPAGIAVHPELQLRSKFFMD